jgi:beta-lactamase class A
MNKEANHPLNTINQDIDRLIQQYPQATVAVALHDGQSGAELLIRPHELFHPASTIKIGVMFEVYHQAGQSLLSLDDSIPIVNEFTSLADGSAYSLSEEDDSEATLYRRLGQTVSLRELVFLMITQSSNFATNLLIERVKAERATSFMRELGAEDILVLRGLEDDRAFALGMNNVASAYGLMHLLQGLAEGRVVSRTASDEMIQVLLAQAFNEGIPAGLPTGMRVAHKTGWIPGIYHDAGIVFPEARKPFCLVVMTRGIVDKLDAHALVAAISRLCHDNLMRS